MKPGDRVTVSITNEVLTVKSVKTFVASCYDESGNVVVKSIEVLNPVV